ncbi:N(4)-(beta-N-acetylglucosaminyl)-L-asparaginase-like [Babylonia areolata]|uniref:N(4)-(beta-N-acetylglucosaminyl)-L-asparaginase- like n=1 Tax=Babylonia areolata TaxID=304850 RepID=UPI003FD1FF6C
MIRASLSRDAQYHMTGKMALRTTVPVFLLLLSAFLSHVEASPPVPLVINTWPFTNATEKAWQVLQISGAGHGLLDALVAGCGECQTQRCDGTVGYGGSPDESGETTLDAMIMNGDTFEVGAVGDLRRVKDAIGVARAVMEYTEHTLIVGESATRFAVGMGFKEESLSTNSSRQMWKDWRARNCQPNYRQNVTPDPRSSCGPYRPLAKRGRGVLGARGRGSAAVGPDNHDTIGMVVVDEGSHVMAGTSTNGMNHKVPGRVGDSPVMGAGAYAWSKVGGAAATGDGDIMMRFLPSFQAVNLLQQGRNVTQAAREAIAPIAKFFPHYVGALIVADAVGNFDAACHGLSGGFHYSVVSPATAGKVRVFVAQCS